MKKAIVILSTATLIAGGCGQWKNLRPAKDAAAEMNPPAHGSAQNAA
ncbi:MAG: hypothetical protein LBB74_06720 [Chitinispirillales bacterium]|nr:hypothetical protein [Chitinispirillales bacterium]